MSRKLAVVLFSLGGPDRPEAVEPFLFNLFNDRAMIGVPKPIRFLLAKAISKRRAPVARKIYDQLGGPVAFAGNQSGARGSVAGKVGGERQDRKGFCVHAVLAPHE